HTPGSPASIRHHRGSGPGTFALPARAGSLFPSQISATWGFGANATEMPFCAPPTDRTEAIVPVQIGGYRLSSVGSGRLSSVTGLAALDGGVSSRVPMSCG